MYGLYKRTLGRQQLASVTKSGKREKKFRIKRPSTQAIRISIQNFEEVQEKLPIL